MAALFAIAVKLSFFSFLFFKNKNVFYFHDNVLLLGHVLHFGDYFGG